MGVNIELQNKFIAIMTNITYRLVFNRKKRLNALGKALVQIEARQQSPDHPIRWNVPETDYLKFYIFQIV